MSPDPNTPPAVPDAPITAAGMMLGLRKVSVLMPGIVVFAVAFGAAAAAKGLTLFQTLLMSGFVSEFHGPERLFVIDFQK